LASISIPAASAAAESGGRAGRDRRGSGRRDARAL